MTIVTKEEAAVRLKVHPNTVVNYLMRCPEAAVRDREISRAILVDIDKMAQWMRSAMPDKYGDLVIDDRDMPLEQLGQTVHVGRQRVGRVVANVPTPIDQMDCGEDVMAIVPRNEDAMLELLWPKAQIEVGRRYRWWVRSLAAVVVIAVAIVGGMGWYLSEARTLSSERAGQVAAAGLRIDRMGRQVISASERADRLEAGLREAVAGREALGVELVTLTGEKGRLELLVSQGEDEGRSKERMILELSGRIDELVRRIGEYEGRVVVASDIGGDN